MRDGLIMAIADNTKQAKLRTICIMLNSLGKAIDYSEIDSTGNPTSTRYIDMVTIGEVSLGKLNDVLFNKKPH